MWKKCPITFDEVVSVDNLCAAWQEFLVGKRSKYDVQEFQRSLGDEILRLHEDLLAERYRHGAYHHFAVNDPKPRDIHKASVRDRLLHHAIHRQLYPFFSQLFIADSFSCQKGKGTHRALRRFSTYGRKVSGNGTRTCWVLKCDIRKFFASLDHGILIALLQRHIDDSRLLNLLARIISSFTVTPGKGLPLGNLTSQLFANVYMHEFDLFVKHRLRAHAYIRYADDFVILSSHHEEPTRMLLAVERYLREQLGLRLHPKKVSLTTLATGVDFLGWVHFPHHCVPRTSTKCRAFRRLRHTPSDEVLQSYLGLFGHGDAYALCQDLQNLFWLWSLSTSAR